MFSKCPKPYFNATFNTPHDGRASLSIDGLLRRFLGDHF